MADRLKSLERIGAVQRQMVRLADLKVAEAARAVRDLEADQTRLRSYLVVEGQLGLTLAKAVLKTTRSVENKLVQAERLRDTRQADRDTLKRREQVTQTMTDAAAIANRRATEALDLERTIETWLHGQGASLP